MFRHVMKIVHLLALAGFAGGLAAALLLAGYADDAPPSLLAALRTAIASLGEALVVPSLVLMIVSGMLLVVARPQLVGARWLWAKAVLTVAVAAVALGIVQPALTRAAGLAAEGALGTPAPAEMLQAFTAERAGGAASLLLVVLTVALAVWRPRLGQRQAPGARSDPYAPAPTPPSADGDAGRAP